MSTPSGARAAAAACWGGAALGLNDRSLLGYPSTSSMARLGSCIPAPCKLTRLVFACGRCIYPCPPAPAPMEQGGVGGDQAAAHVSAAQLRLHVAAHAGQAAGDRAGEHRGRRWRRRGRWPRRELSGQRAHIGLRSMSTECMAWCVCMCVTLWMQLALWPWTAIARQDVPPSLLHATLHTDPPHTHTYTL